MVALGIAETVQGAILDGRLNVGDVMGMGLGAVQISRDQKGGNLNYSIRNFVLQLNNNAHNFNRLADQESSYLLRA